MGEIFSGKQLLIENLGNSKAKINKIGMSWQETRSGKNILPITAKTTTVDGITFTINEDKSVTMNGTNTGTSNMSFQLCFAGELLLAENTTYKITGKPNVSGIYLQATYYKEGTRVYVAADKEFTTVEESTNIATGAYAYIRVDTGITVNNLTIYPMITLASEKDMTYEPYGAMPSPEFPSEIRNVTGSAKITVCNKNLLKSLRWNNGTYIYAKLPKLNTRYFLSLRLKEGKTIPNDLYFGFSSDGDYNNSGFTKWLIEKGVFSSYNSVDKDNFKYTSNIRYEGTLLGYIAVFPVTYAGTLEDYFDIQLEEETNSEYPTDYVESKSQTFLFPLSEGQKMYKDSYLADDGVHHKKYKEKIDGTQTITKATSTLAPYGYYFTVSITQTAKYINFNSYVEKMLCSHFKIVSNNIENLDKGFMTLSSSKNKVCFFIDESITTVDQVQTWLLENSVTVEYELDKELIEPYTAEQENVYIQLQNIELYDGINHIFIQEEPNAEIEAIVMKLIEDYDSYISSKGRLIIPKLNIDYLVDLTESNLPTMPEAVESSVRAAGRDGDVVLNTTYEPIPFNIVCYTEDNLTLLEKVEEEKKINRFLNSIKNKTITFALEKSNKFHDVKYSGALTTINYPKHLKFSIPLKSSESYGKDLIKKSIVGNSVGQSETLKEVGALFILRGPATNPIISLNDYSMEYNMTILEGARVEIDTNKSTVTNINSSGIKTNVMKYYNHQFPKIENGTNELKVLSGFDNDMQVSVIWNDLRL